MGELTSALHCALNPLKPAPPTSLGRQWARLRALSTRHPSLEVVQAQKGRAVGFLGGGLLSGGLAVAVSAAGTLAAGCLAAGGLLGGGSGLGGRLLGGGLLSVGLLGGGGMLGSGSGSSVDDESTRWRADWWQTAQRR